MHLGIISLILVSLAWASFGMCGYFQFHNRYAQLASAVLFALLGLCHIWIPLVTTLATIVQIVTSFALATVQFVIWIAIVRKENESPCSTEIGTNSITAEE